MCDDRWYPGTYMAEMTSIISRSGPQQKAVHSANGARCIAVQQRASFVSEDSAGMSAAMQSAWRLATIMLQGHMGHRPEAKAAKEGATGLWSECIPDLGGQLATLRGASDVRRASRLGFGRVIATEGRMARHGTHLEVLHTVRDQAQDGRHCQLSADALRRKGAGGHAVVGRQAGGDVEDVRVVPAKVRLCDMLCK